MFTPSGTGPHRSQPLWWRGALSASGAFKPLAALSIGVRDGPRRGAARRSCAGLPRMAWSELLPPPYSARSRVHEYGGGEFLVAGGVLYFVNDADQDVYAADLSGGAKPGIRRVTSIADTRFADFTYDAGRNRLIAVGETHGPAALPQNALWHVPLGEGGEGSRCSSRPRLLRKSAPQPRRHPARLSRLGFARDALGRRSTFRRRHRGRRLILGARSGRGRQRQCLLSARMERRWSALLRLGCGRSRQSLSLDGAWATGAHHASRW